MGMGMAGDTRYPVTGYQRANLGLLYYIYTNWDGFPGVYYLYGLGWVDDTYRPWCWSRNICLRFDDTA
ncbi:hypothetical protein M434DRAFT_307284 [Hypoxylon sp. CO27-5]|nr:hypothetical protein M434DRAFT_307284 [Hypoxylon sp. CO27-5]